MPQDNSATPAGKNTENMKEKLIPASLYAAVMFLFFLAGCVGFSLGYDIIGKAGIILSGVFFRPCAWANAARRAASDAFS